MNRDLLFENEQDENCSCSQEICQVSRDFSPTLCIPTNWQHDTGKVIPWRSNRRVLDVSINHRISTVRPASACNRRALAKKGYKLARDERSTLLACFPMGLRQASILGRHLDISSFGSCVRTVIV